MSEECTAVFFPRNFMVSHLMFKSLIHLEFICVWVERVVQFSQYHLLKRLSFSCSCLLCCKWIVHVTMGSFLNSPFCSIDLFVFFVCVRTRVCQYIVFWWLCFFSIAWNRGAWYFGTNSLLANLSHFSRASRLSGTSFLSVGWSFSSEIFLSSTWKV